MFPTTINFFRIRTHICYLLDDKNLEKLQTLWAPTDSSAKMEVTAKIMVGLIIPWKKHGDFRNRITVPLHCMHAKLLQLCPTLCNPMDCSLPGSSVRGDSPGKNTGVRCHALLQGIFPTQGSNPGLLHCKWILYHLSHQGSPRILEWVAYPFSRESSQPKNRTWSPALYMDSLPTELSKKP